PTISVGPIVLGLGVLAAIVCVAVYLIASAPNKGPPLLRFVLVLIAVGVAAYVAGTAIGIAVFCSTASSGNLCGLGGVFGVGPFLSGVCIAGYSYVWLRGTRNAA
ncbi:MAG: hypothetical protein ACRENQ_08295, partial [Gemmatimonadaceae bacterium]